MHKGKHIVCVVPARLHSSRFPKKVLKSLGGKPLLQWVYEGACACDLFDEIVFAVDALETQQLVESFGAVALMTSEQCLNGTERMIEVKKKYSIQGDIWVNWQGDEPLIKPPLILDLLQSIDVAQRDVWTLRKHITEIHELQDPNVVKVVVDHKDRALYFSRHAIPYSRNDASNMWYKHIGIYAFTTEALDTIAQLSPCPLETSEALEQLRFLYYGMQIAAHETLSTTIGIDLPEHLAWAEASLSSSALV